MQVLSIMQSLFSYLGQLSVVSLTTLFVFVDAAHCYLNFVSRVSLESRIPDYLGIKEYLTKY